MEKHLVFKKFTLENILYYLFVLFFLSFPFHSIIRTDNTPFSILILSVIALLILAKLFIAGTFIIPRLSLVSFLVVVTYIFLGSIIYRPLNSIVLRDFAPLLSIIFPFIILNGLDYPRMIRVIKVLILSTFSLSAMIILEYISLMDFSFIIIHKEDSGLSGRLLGLGSDPQANSFGILFFFNTILLLYLFFVKIKNRSKLINLSFFIIFFSFLLVLFLSQGRSTLYGAVISVILYHAFFLKPFKFSQIKGVLSIFLLLILIILLFFNYSSVFERLSYSYSSHRLVRWNSGFDIFLKNPVFGIGRENFKKEAFISLQEDHKFPRREIFPGPMNVHNFYLEVLYTTGMLGFILLIIFIIRLFLLILNLEKLDQELSKHFFIGIVTFLIFNIFHSMFFINIFWIFLGFAELEYHRSKKTLNYKKEYALLKQDK